MKKRINKEALFLLTSVVVCVALVNFMCLVFPALKLTPKLFGGQTVIKVEGIDAVFGGEITINNINILKMKFNFISLLGYIFPLAGAVLVIIGLKKTNPIMYYLAGSLCILGGITTLLEGFIFNQINNLEEIKVSLLAGPIIGGVCGLIAGFISFGSWNIFNKK